MERVRPATMAAVSALACSPCRNTPAVTDRPDRRTSGLYPGDVAPDPGSCVRGVRGCRKVLEPHFSSRAAFRYRAVGACARPGHAWR